MNIKTKLLKKNSLLKINSYYYKTSKTFNYNSDNLKKSVLVKFFM